MLLDTPSGYEESLKNEESLNFLQINSQHLENIKRNPEIGIEKDNNNFTVMKQINHLVEPIIHLQTKNVNTLYRIYKMSLK